MLEAGHLGLVVDLAVGDEDVSGFAGGQEHDGYQVVFVAQDQEQRV